MSRLIDADALIDKLKRTSAFGCVRNAADKNVFEIIEEQPTAYDKEKVIELVDRRIEFLDATSKYFIEIGKPKDAELNAIRLKEIIAIRELIRKGGVE